MGKQAVRKLSNAFEEARSSAFWQRAQGYLEEKRLLDRILIKQWYVAVVVVDDYG